MDFKFSKESGNSQPQETPGEKKNQSALLVLLLVLVGGFTYLYFFTNLIKPQEVQKPAESPVTAPQVVKMPLPARTGEAAKSIGGTTEKAGAVKPAAPPPVAVVAPAAAPTTAPAATPAKTVPAAKAAPTVQAKAKEETKKPDAAKPADKKPLPATVASKSPEKTPAAKSDAKKSVTAGKKGTPTKEAAKKPASTGKEKPLAAAKTKAVVKGSWMLTAGNYVLEEELSGDMGRARKAGFEPKVTQSSRKKASMNRLFVSEFNDRPAAQSSLEKLKRLTSDAFIIQQGGKYAVYAGSYLNSESAVSEKSRLSSAGIAVTVKHSDISIPTQSMSIGPFDSKKGAETALKKLKSAGIKATISPK